MSKFFRSSPDSDSSTSSDSEDLDDHTDDASAEHSSRDDNALTKVGSSDGLAHQSGSLTNTQQATEPSNRRDLLLHALLEEKCLNDVRRKMPDASETVIKRKGLER